MGELMELVPIPVLEYALLRPDIQEDKELVLDEKTLLPLLADFEHAAALDASGELPRADYKKAISYSLTEGKAWKAPIVDLLLNYGIWRDWAKVGELLNDPEGTGYIAPYIEGWIAQGWIPDKYVFELGAGSAPQNPELVRAFAEALSEGLEADQIQALVFETAKSKDVPPKELFRDLYTALIGKEMGPRFGSFALAIGVPKLRELLLEKVQ